MTDLPLKRILVLDDEANIVNAVQRELKSPPHVHYRYEVVGCLDPVEALERVKTERFDVVISDYRMPGMNGVEFLNAMAALQPDCARLVLSGQTDMDALVRMINETHVYRFIPKPWHDYYLKGSVWQALDYAATVGENRRLAAWVRERNIPVPSLDEGDVDHVLIVDDDPGVLAGLARVLTHHARTDDLFAAIRAEAGQRAAPVLREGNISVQVSPSPHHALKMAESVTFSCIVADFRMPEMHGIDLLQRFAEIQPDCERILISGELGENDLIYAVDSAHIFAFIDKPWSDYELKTCVALALAHRRMQRENRMLAEMVRKSGALSSA